MLQKILLGVLGLIFAFGVILVALRIPSVRSRFLTLVNPCTPAEGIDLFSQAVGDTVEIIPCAYFFYKDEPQPEFYNFIRYNNFGLHDSALTFNNPDDHYRVLMIGDSFVQSNETDLTEAFPYLLERQLDIEIVNMGIQTLNTSGQLGAYATLGWQFEPDLVVLVFYMGNDVFDNYFAFPHMVLNEGGNLVANRPDVKFDASRFPDSPAYQWLVQSYEQGVVEKFVAPESGTVLLDELGLYLPESPDWEAAWTLTERLILQFRDLVQAEGSDFAVVILPDRRAVYSDYQTVTFQYFPDLAAQLDFYKPYPRLAQFLDENAIPYFNMQPALTQWAGNHPHEHLYYRVDGHFNLSGHQQVAQILGGWLAEVIER